MTERADTTETAVHVLITRCFAFQPACLHEPAIVIVRCTGYATGAVKLSSLGADMPQQEQEERRSPLIYLPALHKGR